MPKKFTEEYVKEFIELNNCELIDGIYKNCESKLTVKFECGHVGDVSFEHFKKGQRCVTCKYIRGSEKRKTTLDEAKLKIFNRHGNNIIILDFKNGHDKVKFQCNICGHAWETTLHSVYTRSGCPNCNQNKGLGKNIKFTYDYVKKYIEDEGCQLLSKEYIRCDIKLEVKFDCGHTNEITFEHFKNGVRCGICRHKNNAKSKRISEESVIKYLMENNLNFIEFPDGYEDHYSLVKFSCIFGHINIKQYKSVIIRPICYECFEIQNIIKNSGSNSRLWKGGYSAINSFVRGTIDDWKKRSMINCNYKCIFTGSKDFDIHHLFSLNCIIDQSLLELGFTIHEFINEYSNEELIRLSNKVNEVQDRYPLGVCVDPRYHQEFHNQFGFGYNTPEQFYEFQKLIVSGEISIN
jgi:hypothetical protein